MVFRKFRESKQWGRYNTRIFKRLALRQQEVPMPPFKPPSSIPEHLYNSSPAAKSAVTRQKNSIFWNDIAVHEFNGSQPMSDGVAQACTLVGALAPRPFPEHILASNRLQWPANLDALVADSILAGERYDPTLEKLPKEHDPILFWTIKEYLYGTPVVKRNNIILANLYRKVLFTAMQHGMLKENRCDYDADLNAPDWTDKNRTPLYIYQRPHLTIQRRELSAPIANEEEINSTVQENTPDVSPIVPTIDLKLSNCWDLALHMPRQDIADLHLNTIMFTKNQDQKYPFTREQLAANAIVFAAGAASAMQMNRDAKSSRMSMNPNKEPIDDKRPLLAKAIQLVDGKLDLVAFQLNAPYEIYEKKKDEVKNLVWLEQGLPLYKSLSHVKNIEEVEELNVETFKKFANLILY